MWTNAAPLLVTSMPHVLMDSSLSSVCASLGFMVMVSTVSRKVSKISIVVMHDLDEKCQCDSNIDCNYMNQIFK